jgi:hypothetical protein
MSDEERYDEEQAKKRKRAGNKRKKTAKKGESGHSKPSRRGTGQPQTKARPTPKKGDDQ